MNRIQSCFNKFANDNRKGLIGFITAGDPDLSTTVELMATMANSGVDIIELGVPFSDPMAEGPIIQRASERALNNKTYLKNIFETIRAFRKRFSEVPIVLMGYLNPIEYHGYKKFAKEANEAGVDGVLTVDLPPEEAAEYCGEIKANGLSPIFLASPTTTEKRVTLIDKIGSGFIYYVSLKGVTGARHFDGSKIVAKIQQIKQNCRWPVAVGFGIRTIEDAVQAATVADAIVIGSAIVEKIEQAVEQNQSPLEAVRDYLAPIRDALDNLAQRVET